MFWQAVQFTTDRNATFLILASWVLRFAVQNFSSILDSPVFSIDYFRVVSRLWLIYWSKQTTTVTVKNQYKKPCKLKI